MVLGFAGDYIAIGENIEEKQELLNGAVSAWNIACLEEKKRKRAIKVYMVEYRKLNSTHVRKGVRCLNNQQNINLFCQMLRPLCLRRSIKYANAKGGLN